MRRFTRVLLLGFLALLLVGAKPDRSVKWDISQWIQQPVEQQTVGGATQPDQSLWVVNNTGCIWDADDRLNVWGIGQLAPGEVVRVESCVVADWTGHLIGLDVGGRGNSKVRVTLRVGSWSNSIISHNPVANAQKATLCLFTPDYDHSYPLPPVLDSGVGGVGIIHPITIEIENLGRHTLRKMLFMGGVMIPYWQAGGNVERYCGESLECIGRADPNMPVVCWSEE